MSGLARQRAEEEQRRASDPAVSTFVAASAGSGKTKLLTDRLLRLILGGADPARVQCLTFTKAAAAEMDLRLRAVLGRWVTSDDAVLDEELRRLQLQPGAELRARARGLFATVLDLPGGMRIGTIHAFCQALLRRFPLEAGISPHFQVIEDADAESRLAVAREAALAEAHTDEARAALDHVAPLASAKRFAGLVEDLRRDAERLETARNAGLRAPHRALGATAASERELLDEAVRWSGDGSVREAIVEIAANDACAPTVRERCRRMLDWLARDPGQRVSTWNEWFSAFHNADGAPCRPSALVNEKLCRARPDLRVALVIEQLRVGEAMDRCRTLRLADISAALLALAAPVSEAYDSRKESAALLDYDDLIARTAAVLRDPGVAWVLYKLDGGLDHLLLDEVQDTAPAQWRIAGALTEEFFAGKGANEAHRTVFAVGDRKQSIYSFQGADPDEFDRWASIMRERVVDSGRAWRDVALDVSFRSTAPILAVVDAVFADPTAAAGVVEPGTPMRHFAERAGHAGSVELWPLAPAPDRQEPPPWAIPSEYPKTEASAPQRLAEALSAWIDHQIHSDVRLESQNRPLEAGDILVLVRRRNEFGRALVRSLKSRGVPVAGLDRLVLTEQPAVADLLALCDVLLLPEDDLSLACVLTSPLGGLNDDDLLELAPLRQGTLWDTLRIRASERPHWQRAWDFLAGLFARVDYTTPHALLAEALGPLGGRARLLARLGEEAAEPVDELLNAALAFVHTNPPSLQGFVHWVRQSAAEVKREPEVAGRSVRVMTVHGAKGLQAPLVILPDTTGIPPERDELLWCRDPRSGADVPIWVPRKEFRCVAANRLREQAKRRRTEEHNRLLYVALTRAEDRLVVCGWQPRNGALDECWYRSVQRGFERLRIADPAAVAVSERAPESGGLPWSGGTLRVASPQILPPVPRVTPSASASVPIPSWAGAAPDWRADPPPPEPTVPEPLAPSRPEGAALGPVPHANSPLATREQLAQRLERGRLLHALLQHLPELPPARRREAGAEFLARAGQRLATQQIAAFVAETMAILEHPELAPLFGPGSRAEVPLSGVVAGNVIGGLVDRMAVLPHSVFVADYKTNREPPRAVEDTPVLYIRQMAAYRAVLRAIFPDRPVVCALVWTQAARVMTLPSELLDRHAPRMG